MKKFFKKVYIFQFGYLSILLVASVVLGFNCSGFAPMGDGSNSSLSAVPDGSIPVGLLSAEQILKTMLSSTGTENAGSPTAADDLIMQTYTLRSGSLPSEQSLDQATGPMLISVANLASAVCAKAVANDQSIPDSSKDTRLFFRELDFSQGLSQGNLDAAVVSAFNRLARNSWRRDTTTDEQGIAAALVSDFKTGASMTDNGQTTLLAVSVCTAVLSSIDALTY